MSQVITYETLFDILRKESSRDELQTLDKEFYNQVHEYLQEKKDASKSGYRSKIEYENSKKILKELYDRRERKLLLLALNKARTQSAIIETNTLLDKEKELFDKLVSLLDKTKKDTLTSIIGTTLHKDLLREPITTKEEPQPTIPKTQAPLESTEPTHPEQTIQETPIEKPPKKNPTPHGYKKVKFLHAVPKFIGKDMTIFGPYDPGAETELPEEIVQVLLKKGRIEEL